MFKQVLDFFIVSQQLTAFQQGIFKRLSDPKTTQTAQTNSDDIIAFLVSCPTGSNANHS